LGERDTVARCAIDPQFRENHSAGAPFDEKRLLYFRQDKQNRRVHQLSVGWRALLPNESDVHQFGCRTAANQNRRRGEKLKRIPQPLVEAAHYLGYYDIAVADALSAANEIYDVRITNIVEEGEVAHCNFDLVERENIDQNAHKSAYKTKIVVQLWRAASGPARHICEHDQAYRDILSAVHLPSTIGSSGPLASAK
jgi:hypothetical protein